MTSRGINRKHYTWPIGLFRFLKSTVLGLIPPFIQCFCSRAKEQLPLPLSIEQQLQQERLFNGNDSLFKSLVQTSRVYAEFGCGKSTVWVAKNANCKMISVDTSSEWVNLVNGLVREIATSREFTVKHVDLGKVGDWGIPLTFERREKIWDYVNAPWDSPNQTQPDTILIDGRFRVACFLNCLLCANPGTNILFDDYVGRRHYHIVEEFCSISSKCGRQALFIVPETIDKNVIKDELSRFLYVRE